jgi:hypothetical protein
MHCCAVLWCAAPCHGVLYAKIVAASQCTSRCHTEPCSAVSHCALLCHAVLCWTYLVSKLMASGMLACSSSEKAARLSGLQAILRLSASCMHVPPSHTAAAQYTHQDCQQSAHWLGQPSLEEHKQTPSKQHTYIRLRLGPCAWDCSAVRLCAIDYHCLYAILLHAACSARCMC